MWGIWMGTDSEKGQVSPQPNPHFRDGKLPAIQGGQVEFWAMVAHAKVHDRLDNS
jgi:hypothetical protein